MPRSTSWPDGGLISWTLFQGNSKGTCAVMDKAFCDSNRASGWACRKLESARPQGFEIYTQREWSNNSCFTSPGYIIPRLVFAFLNSLFKRPAALGFHLLWRIRVLNLYQSRRFFGQPLLEDVRRVQNSDIRTLNHGLKAPDSSVRWSNGWLHLSLLMPQSWMASSIERPVPFVWTRLPEDSSLSYASVLNVMIHIERPVIAWTWLGMTENQNSYLYL